LGTESVQAEAKTVAAVFPSPAAVMSILVQVSSFTNFWLHFSYNLNVDELDLVLFLEMTLKI